MEITWLIRNRTQFCLSSHFETTHRANGQLGSRGDASFRARYPHQFATSRVTQRGILFCFFLPPRLLPSLCSSVSPCAPAPPPPFSAVLPNWGYTRIMARSIVCNRNSPWALAQGAKCRATKALCKGSTGSGYLHGSGASLRSSGAPSVYLFRIMSSVSSAEMQDTMSTNAWCR